MNGDLFMDYDNLYRNFMKYCKSTSPRERLRKRNAHDKRLNKSLYVEKHHIIPRAVGGSDEPSNLVFLLPEEHILAHKIRFKAYNTRCDMLAVRFILNGLASRGHICPTTKLRLNKKILASYAWIRSNSANFRKMHGWQTLNGKKRISASRKGTMPVKDAITGERIGSVSVDHPNVISGKWVHTTTGRKLTSAEKAKLKDQSGKNNGNYKAFATRNFLLSVLANNLEIVTENNMFLFKKFNIILKKIVLEEHNTSIHAKRIIDNRFGNIDEFLNQFNVENNKQISYNPYYRSKEHRAKLSSASASYIWVNNGIEQKRIKINTPMPIGWLQGKINVKNKKIKS